MDAKKKDDDWREARKRESMELRKKLQGEAETLLTNIGDELIKLNANVELRPEFIFISKPGASSWRDKDTTLKVNGEHVPLRLDQYRKTSGYSTFERDQLNVLVGWIFDHDVIVKQKTFSWSKQRPATFGFSVPDIAKYILWWVEQKKAYDIKSGKRNAALSDWKKAANRLIERLNVPKGTIRHTEGGLELSFKTDERRAEAALLAAGYKFRTEPREATEDECDEG